MEVVLELQSLSKAYNMAGWRIGMVCGNQAHIQDVLKIKSNMDSGMFFGLQQGAIAALAQGTDWFSDINKIYSSRRKRVWELAEALGTSFERETAGMFVWAKLPENAGDSEAYIDQLLEKHHIFIAPGTIFGSAGKGYVRFSLCVPEERIKEALKRIKS
jgi:aspartate/methionine/tyrosine aminotransferase